MGLLYIIAMVVLCVMVGEKKGYNAALCGVAGFFGGLIALIVIALLPDKKKAAEEAAAQQRKINEMRARIRELEEQQKPAEKKAPAEKTVDVYMQGMQFYRQKEYFKAYPLLTEAAQQGRVKAQYTLGIMHRYGQGCKLDEEEALRWLEAAGEQGHLEAQKACASMYTVDKKDTKKMLYWHEKAAAQGDAEAQYATAFYNRDDPKTARYWAEKAAAQGHEGAQTLLNHLKPVEPAELPEAEPTKQSQPVAEQAPVQSRAEQLTDEERAVQINYIEGVKIYDLGMHTVALSYFQKSAEKGHLHAQMYCAQIYYYGQGRAVDYEQALYWYEQAAMQGAGTAQANLAKMYYNGEGCAVNYEKALYWYEKAAEQGDANAQLWAGMLYELGRGTEVDAKKARYWYEKAAAQGNENARKLLSKMR